VGLHSFPKIISLREYALNRGSPSLKIITIIPISISIERYPKKVIRFPQNFSSYYFILMKPTLSTIS